MSKQKILDMVYCEKNFKELKDKYYKLYDCIDTLKERVKALEDSALILPGFKKEDEE